MSKIRALAATALLAAVALTAASCGKGSGGDADKVVIWVQMDPEERGRFAADLAEFQAAHPGVKIEQLAFDTEQLRNQFQTAAASGGGPDLVFGPSDQVGPLSLLKLIRPLDETLPAGYFDRFIPAALDTLDGHLYALPDQVGNHLVLCYNRKLVPEPPETFDEFLAVARRVRESGGAASVYPLAFQQNEPYWLAPFFAGCGGWVMDEARRPTLDTPAMVEALQLLRDLKDKYQALPRESDYQVATTLFKEGRAAMLIDGPWGWSGFRKAGVDLGVAPIFRLPNGRWAQPMTASKGYSVNVNVKADKLPLVLEVLEHLTSPEVQRRKARELSVLPSDAAAYGDSALAADPTMAASRRAFELGRRMPVVPEMRVIWDAMRPGMQDALNGAKSPAEAAREMQKLAVEQIEGMRK